MGNPSGPSARMRERCPVKKALVIGISKYKRQTASQEHSGGSDLRGSRQDAHDFQEFLCRDCGYPEEAVTLMTDETNDPQMTPTMHNMLREIHQLVKGVQPSDLVVFYYASHGGIVTCIDHTETDGLDEGKKSHATYREIRSHITSDIDRPMHRCRQYCHEHNQFVPEYQDLQMPAS